MRKRERPRLYPRHQHQWAEQDPDPDGLKHLSSDFTPPPRAMVVCTVCGFQAPRNAAGLDGVLPPKTVPVTDKGVAT